jgi:hypothetical protein
MAAFVRAALVWVAVVFCTACSSSDGGDPPAGEGTGASAGADPSGAGASNAAGGAGDASTGAGAGAGTGAAAGGAGQGAGGADGSWGPEHCPAAANVGYEVGQQLPDITVKDCDGADVSLAELCGASALWIFAAHGWCPLCQSVSAQAEAIHDAHAGQNLASVNIVVADGQDGPPTAEYCKLWRDQHGHADVITLYDPTGSILALWSGSTSLSAFVSSDRVIVSKLEHDSNVDHIEAGIATALAD